MTRWLRPALAGLVGLLALLAAACSSTAADGADPTPTRPAGGPPITEPPAADLKDTSGALTRGAAGTRCWGGLCIDMLGPLTQVDPVQVDTGESLEVVFEAGPPAEVVHSWIPAPSPPPAPDNGVRVWGTVMPITNDTGDIEAPAAPGMYVLLVFARWDAPVRGDVTYGFYVEVR